MKKTISLILTLVLAAGLLVGCQSASVGEEELNIAIFDSPSTVDPQVMADANAAFVVRFSNTTLFTYDENRRLVPSLAESYECSKDGRIYTFHLKKGLKWSDGRDLTAADFVFSFHRLADPEVGSNAVYLITDSCLIKNAGAVVAGEKPVSELGVSAPDAETFVVELEQPCPYFCNLVCMANFSPCNEAFYDSMGEHYGESGDTLLSSGAYIMDHYEPLAMQIHFTKNPYYVDADKITVPNVTLEVASDGQQALMCYKAGLLDVTMLSGGLLDLAEGDPGLKVYPSPNMYYLDVNQQTCPALKNRNIRMALSKSLDRKVLAEKVLKTGSDPLSRIIMPDFYMEADGTDFGKDADRYDEWAGYDPKKAQSLWKKGLEELGESEVTLKIVSVSEFTVFLEALKEQMEKNLPGLSVTIKPVPFKQLLECPAKGNYDLMFYGWLADYADPSAFLALYISSATKVGYHNKAYDKAYEEIMGEKMGNDPEARDQLMHKMEDMLMKDAGVIPVYVHGTTFLVRDTVKGFQLSPTGVDCIMTGLSKEVR